MLNKKITVTLAVLALVLGGCGSSTPEGTPSQAANVATAAPAPIAPTACPTGSTLNPATNTCVTNTTGMNIPPITQPINGVCATGTVYHSSYGCLPQSTCPAGQGVYNNICIAGTGTPVTNNTQCPSGYVLNSATNTCVQQTTGQCSTGFSFSTTYGCLPQNSCPVGYGQYGTSCVPTTATQTSYNPGTTGTNSCQSGYVLTQYGCLTQGSCPQGQVTYNNQCYTLVNNSGANAGFNFNWGWNWGWGY